jgi:hypothetical protein
MINETFATTARPDAIRSISDASSSSGSHAIGETFLSWMAFAAVVMGVIGVVGGTLSSRSRRPSTWRARGDRYEMTPPHGDKLHPQF